MTNKPEKRQYKCLGCNYISPDEEHALNHQVKCDSAMEQINTTKSFKEEDESQT